MALTALIDKILAEDDSGLLQSHAHWNRIKLGEVATLLNGYPFESRYFARSGGMPLVRIRDVASGQTDTFYNGPYDEEYVIAQGDLLVGMDGDFACALWKSTSALLNQRVCKVTPDERFLRREWLAFVLPAYLKAVNQRTSSVTVKHLSSRTLSEIPIPIPSIEEQNRIVSALELLLANLGEGEQQLRAAQVKLTIYRQSVLDAALIGELTDTRRQSFGEVDGCDTLFTILAAQQAELNFAKNEEKSAHARRRLPGTMTGPFIDHSRDDQIQLYALPAGWIWSTIGECFEVVIGATPSRANALFWNGGVPWVSSGEVQFGRIAATRETISAEALQRTSARMNPVGSVMLGMIGEGRTRGQAAILDIEAANNQNCAAIWVGKTPIPPEYIFYWLWSRYEETRRGGGGSNQQALNKKLVQEIPFPLPSITEMHEIVDVLQTRLAEIDDQERAVADGLKYSASQRHNLLLFAVSGKLVEPGLMRETDEELLQRVRELRADRSLSSPILFRKVDGYVKEEAVEDSILSVLRKSTDWLDAQEVFRRCGATDGSDTDLIEKLYVQLRTLVKEEAVEVRRVKQQDQLRVRN